MVETARPRTQLRPARPAAAPVVPPWQVSMDPGQSVILMPGQMCFGGGSPGELRTLLGSCVSITLWHPQRRLGGMCHFLLPRRDRRPDEVPDGRYGDEAVGLMVLRLKQAGTRPEDYVAHLYGGADTMPGNSTVRFNIGERNIERGWQLIEQHGFQLEGVDVGEDVPRTVTLDLGDGTVQMRRGIGHAPPNAAVDTLALAARRPA
jgi:chemotaxis protein CheD